MYGLSRPTVSCTCGEVEQVASDQLDLRWRADGSQDDRCD